MSQKLPIAPVRVSRPGRLKKAHIAVLSALIMATSGSYAASFGKLTVLSSLGQPFKGEIELNSYQGDDDSNLTVKLASVATYKKANIDLSPALLTMQFVLEQRGNRKVVKISSDQAVNDPYMDMLVELGGNKARVVREYTVLLEPQGMRAPETPPPQQNSAFSTRAIPMTAPVGSGYQPLPQSATRTAPANRPLNANDPAVQEALALQRRRTGAGNLNSDSSAAVERIPSSRPASAPSASVAPASPRTNASSGDGERLRVDTVARGETLRQVAGRNLTDGVSLDQMLVALFRANQDSFIEKNMNLIRAGAVLTVPVASVVKEIPPSEARSEIQAQTKDFNSYRNALAAKVGSSEATPAATATQSGAGRIGATVKDNASTNAAPTDTLKLSRGNTAGNDSSVAGSTQGGSGTGNAKDLQKDVDDLKKVLEVQNQSLAKMQNQAAGDKAAPATAATPAPVVKSGPATEGSNSVSGQIAPTDASAVPPASPNTGVSPVQQAAPGTATNSVSGTVAQADGTPAADGTAAAPAAGDTLPQTQPEPKKPVHVVAPAAPEEGFLSKNPLALPLGGAVVVLLGAIGLMRSRKKRKQDELFGSDSEDGATGSQPLQTNSLFAATGGQDVDTKNSMFNSSFVPNLNHIDTNVDPVAEADVYIAYGRDAQAEEILKEALHSQPGRNGIRLKLLEIYAIRKDTRSFEVMAGELYSLTRGEGPDWATAAGLGVKIDPDNPLYAGGNMPSQVVERADAITAPTQPMSDEDYSAAMRAGAQQDYSAQESSAEHDEQDDLQYDNLGAVTMPYEPSPAKLASQADKSAPIFEPFNDEELNGRADDNSLEFDVADEQENERNQNTVFVHPDSMNDTDAFDLAGNQKLPDAHSIDFDLGDTDGQEFGKPVTTHTPDAAESEYPLDAQDMKAVEATLPTAAHSDEPVSAEEAALNIDIETKLDLASAYQEIGDVEGARELLMEIMRSGSAKHATVAQEMLDKMS